MGAELAPLVLLAGGRSARAGEPKGLIAVGGRPWIERQLEAFAACGGARAIVVLGHDRDAYAALAWIDFARPFAYAGLGVEIAINAAPERGPFSSLVEGARRVAGAAFVLPVDVPCPRAGVWTALAGALASGAAAAIPVHAGRGGHPVLLGAPLVASCLAIDPSSADARLDAVLRAAGAARVDVDDASIATNLNTPADWEKMRNDLGDRAR